MQCQHGVENKEYWAQEKTNFQCNQKVSLNVPFKEINYTTSYDEEGNSLRLLNLT